MLGYLVGYLKLSSDDKKELKIIGRNFLEQKTNISYKDKYDNLKNLFFLMIRKSALLEKLKIHLENPEVILGFLTKFNWNKVDEYQKKGKELFDKKQYNKIISDAQKLELIKLFLVKNIDSTSYIFDKFKKTIHSLTYMEYKKIVDDLVL